MSAAEPWYKDGLRFQCSQCGDCCTGGAGYVWV
ncbi:MAG: YkgJ family cysteine cluster protein, partial [Planctomycetota bacterium]